MPHLFEFETLYSVGALRLTITHRMCVCVCVCVVMCESGG